MSETMGRCRSEVDSYRKPEFHYAAIADAIDRLKADVAAVKEAVCDGSVAEERDRFFAGWAYALNERAKLRAEVERLRAELAARPAANSPEIPDSSPADPPPAAPPAGWLTQEERQIIANLLLYQWGNLGWPARVVHALNAILARAGSPPVVEVPAMRQPGPMTIREKQIHVAYRDAMDAAGVAWKEVGRE